MNPSSLLFNELDFYNENIVKKKKGERKEEIIKTTIEFRLK